MLAPGVASLLPPHVLPGDRQSRIAFGDVVEVVLP